MKKVTVVTINCWFINLCGHWWGFVPPSLVPAPTALNLPENFSQAVVCDSAPAHREQGDVRGPQMQEEFQSELSQWLRAHQGDTLGNCSLQNCPSFCGSCAYSPLVQGPQPWFASTTSSSQPWTPARCSHSQLVPWFVAHTLTPEVKTLLRME